MKILVIYASRYGATKEVSELLAIDLKLKGCDAEAVNVSDAKLSGADVYLLGSGIYANKFLPEMEEFINVNKEEFGGVNVGLFATAMRTEPSLRQGKMSGGVYLFDKYPVDPFIRKMLHGRIDFSLLNDDDRIGLERFYNTIGLTEDQKAERRKLRDEISEEECNLFADEILSVLK